jgi:EmrB/QacA subfamily drug resistance transporter
MTTTPEVTAPPSTPGRSTAPPPARLGAANGSGEPTAGADPRRWLALVVVAVAQLMVVLDASIVNIALPSAQRSLHISNADRQWVITAYTLAFGGLLLLGGRIADYVGRKRIFLIGLVGFAVASGLGGLAPNEGMLFAARALQGAFAALLAPAALSLITVTFTEQHERSRAFAVYGGISGAGAAIGLILGGVLTEYASWRWCLLVNVPIALAAAAAGSAVVRESRAGGNTRYDVPGAVLVTGGLVAIVYGFTEAAKAGVGWAAPSTIALLAGGVVLLAAFVLVEQRAANPLLPLRVVLERNRAGAFAASFLAWAGLFAMFLFLAYYFQQNLDYSPVKSGLAFLPFSAGVAVTAGVTPNLLTRFGVKALMLAGALLGTGGLAYLTQIGQHSSWTTHVLPAELAISVGMGLLLVAQSSLALHGVQEHDAGVASAMLNTTQQIGGSLGTALLNTLYASTLVSYLHTHAASLHNPARLRSLAAISGYHRTFLIGAIFMAAASIVIAVLVNAHQTEFTIQQGEPSRV